MKICNTYSHKNAESILKDKPGILEELKYVMNFDDLKFSRGNNLFIKKEISKRFIKSSWIDNVPVKRSKLTINFVKDKVGVCFQIGNVSRTYADILKLCHLHNENVIDVGVIIVPHQIESRIIGTNYAKYDRLEKEIKFFEKILPAPLYLIGLSN